MVALASSAIARPVHRHHASAGPAMAAAADRDNRDAFFASQAASRQTAASHRGSRHSLARARAAAQSHSNSAYGGFTSNALVADARKYIGTNPTGRKSLWCGAFMDMVLKETGHKGGGNLALGYLRYGRRISGPQVGAIAVMGRHGGGHVGVVSGIDANGNPIIVSGNHNHTVAEAVYPRSRISAYVMPGS
jgi:uncharacterized protein (TIGR02594 family)